MRRVPQLRHGTLSFLASHPSAHPRMDFGTCKPFAATEGKRHGFPNEP